LRVLRLLKDEKEKMKMEEKGKGEEIAAAAAAAAEEGVKQQRKKKRKEVFPFGNYRNYYGYRVISSSILLFFFLICFVQFSRQPNVGLLFVFSFRVPSFMFSLQIWRSCGDEFE
jgi:hypothetical protein